VTKAICFQVNLNQWTGSKANKWTQSINQRSLWQTSSFNKSKECERGTPGSRVEACCFSDAGLWLACCALLTWPAGTNDSAVGGPETGATAETDGAATPGALCWNNRRQMNYI
jgi:hypothetical protein